MQIETVSLNSIRPYEKNAKKHPQKQIEQIMQSIREFGNNDPIAVDENNVIIEGHGRYEALKRLGVKNAEVIRLSHLNEQQKKAYILAHNKLTMNSDFDFDILSEEIESIFEIDMSEYGFDLESMFSMEDMPESAGYDEDNDDREYFNKTFTFPTSKKKQVISYLKKHQNEIVQMIIERSGNSD